MRVALWIVCGLSGLHALVFASLSVIFLALPTAGVSSYFTDPVTGGDKMLYRVCWAAAILIIIALFMAADKPEFLVVKGWLQCGGWVMVGYLFLSLLIQLPYSNSYATAGTMLHFALLSCAASFLVLIASLVALHNQ